MQLWREWLRCVWKLRPACTRAATFLWMVLALVGLCIRCDLWGVTSFVRAAWLQPRTYRRLLHLFHTPALVLDQLTALWSRLALTLFEPLRVGDRLVYVADGLKVPKEGRKMPAVKKLHQGSQDNTKPAFIFGHSFQAVGLLVRGKLGAVFSVPLASRIHEGVVFSNRHPRTLLDKLVALFVDVVGAGFAKALLVADAYYCSGKVIRPLLECGHHLLTRARINSVAFQQAPTPRKRQRGRPKKYGRKVRLRDLFRRLDRFETASSPLYDDHDVTIRYRCLDLLWRPVGHLVRFVLVDHPRRGRIILMTTDLSLDALRVIEIYGYRFKIEVGFKQALHTIGAYAYHFWMADMRPISRKRSGNQYLHRATETYRMHVRRKIDAYHRYVQLSCIAQGLLQHLAINFSDAVWRRFKSWMRTMRPHCEPSEAVVAQALRSSFPDYLLAAPDDDELKKMVFDNANLELCPGFRMAG